MIVLYGINLSTFTRKVRLALAEKGIEYRLEVAPMGSPKVRSLHPLGKIPVAEHRDTVIPDSSVIIAYLERTWPAPALYPAGAAELARALWLEEYADTRLREATVPFFAEHIVKPVFQGKSADAQALARAVPLRDECFDYLEHELVQRGFAVGNRLTVADIAIGAQLVTYQQGEGDMPEGRWPGLTAYIAALRSRPSWAAILDEENGAIAAAREKSRPAG
jgi:glutathione S-transferase